jgi:hypothetical protein
LAQCKNQSDFTQAALQFLHRTLVAIKKNMKYLQSLVLILLAFLFQGCFMGADGDTEKVVGSYYISGDYGLKNVHLGFEDKEWGGIGLIEEPIIAIGHNDQYIIVKRETDKLEYFIARITNSAYLLRS